MQLRRLGWVVVALAWAAAPACKPKEYLCTQNAECVASNNTTGLCVASHCAFYDSSCPSGWRFDDTGGAVAEDCVDPALLAQPDAGTPEADAAPEADAPAAVDAAPEDDAAASDAEVPDAAPATD